MSLMRTLRRARRGFMGASNASAAERPSDSEAASTGVVDKHAQGRSHCKLCVRGMPVHRPRGRQMGIPQAFSE
jgi:hypothetical protein